MGEINISPVKLHSFLFVKNISHY